MFFASSYFDHNAFMHHSLHVLEALVDGLCVHMNTFDHDAFHALHHGRPWADGRPVGITNTFIFE